MTLRELWNLQDKLMQHIEPGLDTEDVLDTYQICVKCKNVSPGPKACSCDDQS